MLDALKNIVENSMLSEETRTAIQEAWDRKVHELRESVEVELREEFAQRYDHDKNQLIEALDRMVSDNLKKEIVEFVEDRKNLVAERVKLKKQMKEHAEKINQFVLEQLAKEMKEFKAERAAFRNDVVKLESFVVKNLSKEIVEFAQDKKELVEAKVKLIAESKEQINTLKQAFIKKAAVAVDRAVTEGLKRELNQLKEDVDAARKNHFGQRIFEAFAKEFAGSHYSETGEIRNLRSTLQKAIGIAESAAGVVREQKKLVEIKQKEISTLKNTSAREKVMGELLAPLGKRPRAIMEDLLRTVPTVKLNESFEKYLPSVLNESAPTAAAKRTLVETRKEVTGDKPVKDGRPAAEIFDLRKLAGLK
jgi:hypothetical protein